ncbi:MAG: cysteine-rich CWC family protein [Bacteroidales bacterium]|nr:cysteine-rich CWC family protein [Bacteroidales bacterium]
MISEPIPQIKICPACNTKFECLHSNDCWCASFVIPKEKKDELLTLYYDCICADCLIKYTQITNTFC